MTNKVFKEIQRFDQWWIRILLLVIVIITLIPLSSNWDTIDYTTEEIVLHIGIPVLVLLGIYLIYLLKLETEIDEEGVHYRFFPLIPSRKTIRWDEIKECQTTTYSPIFDYGGWGYRLSHKGRAYNVKGNKGIKLLLKNNKKILLGTQNEKQAQSVIETYFKK